MSETLTHQVSLTDSAATKAKTLMDAEGRDDLRLRIVVEQGGCAGYKYQLFFDEVLGEDDTVVDFSGVQVVVDEMSAPHLRGATIDYKDTISSQGFEIDNPNATGTCACGDSFS